MSERIKTHKFKALQDLNNFRGGRWEKGEVKEFTEPIPDIVDHLCFESMIEKVGEGSEPKHKILMEED